MVMRNLNSTRKSLGQCQNHADVRSANPREPRLAEIPGGATWLKGAIGALVLPLALASCGSDEPYRDVAQGGAGARAAEGGGSTADLGSGGRSGAGGQVGSLTGAGAGGAVGNAGGSTEMGGASEVCNEGCPDCAQSNATDLFGYASVPTFELNLPKERWEYLKAHATDEEFVESCVSFEGKPIGNIGLRFKGSYGSLLGCFDKEGKQICSKLSMKIKFNEYSKGLRFYGLKRLNLHAMRWDETRLHDRLAYDLYREMGLEAPRTSWANVTVNGQSLGLFAMVEQVDGAFTKDRWGEQGEGNLFKEAWPDGTDAAYYRARLETNEDTGSGEEFLAFATDLRTASPDQLHATLAKWTDITSLYNYMAVDDAVMDWDGITAFYTDAESNWSGNHNYYWYQEPPSNRFHLIAWDKDATFAPQGTFGQIPRWDVKPADCALTYPVWDGGSEVLAPGCSLLFQALAADRESYRAAVQRLLDGPFAESTLVSKIDQHAAFISAAVATDPLGVTVAAWSSAVARLKSSIPMLRTRLEHLRDGVPIESLAVRPQALNDFEVVDALSVALGFSPYANPATTISISPNTTDPLEGLQDLKISFEYRNEAKGWQQWIYSPIALAGGALDASKLAGLRLKVRSDKKRPLRLELESPAESATESGIRVGWTIPIGPEAQNVEVRFADAKLEGWVIDEGKDPGDDLNAILASVTGLNFHPQCVGRDNSTGMLPEGTTDSGVVQIDALEFFSDP